MSMTILGSKTSPVVIYKSESGKLHHSFPVKSGEKALPGQPVVLNTDGTVQGFKSGDSLYSIIGVAVNSSETPAYKDSKQYGAIEVTVAVKGYAITNALSGAALNAGPVKPNGTITSEGYAKYVQSVFSGTPDGIVTAIALNDAAGADEVIQVMIL